MADYEPYCSLAAEVEISSRGSAKSSLEDAWGHVQLLAGHWALLGYGAFAILNKDSGEYIGETGLCQCRRGLGADFDQADEASWVLSAAYRGRGLALEAALATHAWYAARRGPRRTVCMIGPDNAPSLVLAARLGYRRFRSATHRDGEVLLFQREPH